MSTASSSRNGSHGQARWSLRLFGGFELGAVPNGKRLTSLGKRERVLLAYLALSPDLRQHRRKLATLLWGDSTDETALDNLRTCVWSLRKALGDAERRVVTSDGPGIALSTVAFDVDVLTFRQLAAQSGTLELEAAAKLYGGEFLDGLSIESEEFETWRRAEATRYRDQVIDVLSRLMKQLGEGGETERAIQAGTRILELEPLHEPAVRQLMRLYSESGRRGAAIQLYRTLADALRTELHTQPDGATRQVFSEISHTGEERAPSQVRAAARRLAAIFAADVAGYSRLMGRDEVGTVRALSAARATLDHLIAEYGGRTVNSVGDSVLAEFPSVVDAVQCAIAVQEKFAEAAAPEGPRLPFRIAVHVGDVLSRGTDIFGDGINVCARLQEVAEPGGICISGAAYQYIRKSLPVAFDDLGEKRLKNIDEPVHVFAIRNAKGKGYSPPSSNSTTIAVLAFANMSGDPNQEFFSDGMTEEITSALAKIPNLQVIARTSAFQFKGQNQDVRTVGQRLGASHLIEGSVRKAGDRVRITAQLIHAGDGVHLWSETYDRQFIDIFAIQEEIARAIAAALRAPLGLQPGERLVPNRTADLESYQQYLVARGLYRARGAGVGQAISILVPLVARDPSYAPAWALLARCYSLVPVYSPVTFSGLVEDARRTWVDWLTKMETAGRRAIELDPKHADGYVALACIETMTGKWGEAESLFNQALKLDPNEPEALHYYSVMLTYVGKCRTAMALRERLRVLDPLVPVYDIVTAYVMWIVGQKQAAVAIWEAIPPDALGGFYRNVTLAGAYAAMGRFADAADTLLLITGSQVTRQSVEEAARLIRAAPMITDAPDSLPMLEGDLNFVYVHVGAPDRLMEFAERNLAIGWLGSTANYPIWTPERASFRKTERFKNYVRAAGMVDYWRTHGWPDLCGPTDGNDFVCN